MKLLLFPLIFVLLSSTLLATEICEKMASKDDKTFQKTRVKNYKCKHLWKEGKVVKGLEIVYLLGHCQKFEGGNPINCLMARTCDPRGETFSDYGPSLMLTSEVKKSLCVDSRYDLFAIENSPGVKAWIECKGKKINKIIIEDPLGKRSTCPIPPFKME